jgi:hypothetical protein
MENEIKGRRERKTRRRLRCAVPLRDEFGASHSETFLITANRVFSE